MATNKKKIDEHESVENKRKHGTIADTGNNLEFLLNDVFEKECIFKIENDEVEFIQKGIETLIQNIVDQVLDCEILDKEIGRRIKHLEKDPEVNEYLQNYIKNSLKEVHFTLGEESYFKQHKIPFFNFGTIHKVGSFYEGTKNGFPDEFDFIFPVFSSSEERPSELHLFQPLYSCFSYVNASIEGKLKYETTQENMEGRCLKFQKMSKHELLPIYVCEFIYENCNGEKKNINVDLVPAEKLYVGEDLECYNFFKTNLKKPRSIREVVLSAEYYFKTILGNVTVTPSEVYFMKHKLSDRHRKIYRILKYLINGHGDGEKLKTYNKTVLDMGRVAYSSYNIKTMIMVHHDECSNTNPDSLGPCVIQVLEEFEKYDDINVFPKLGGPNYFTNYTQFCLLPYIKQLRENLLSLQRSHEPYEYNKVKIKPLSRQYLSDIESVPAEVIQERFPMRKVPYSNAFYDR